MQPFRAVRRKVPDGSLATLIQIPVVAFPYNTYFAISGLATEHLANYLPILRAWLDGHGGLHDDDQ
jgi:hypothetical protein